MIIRDVPSSNLSCEPPSNSFCSHRALAILAFILATLATGVILFVNILRPKVYGVMYSIPNSPNAVFYTVLAIAILFLIANTLLLFGIIKEHQQLILSWIIIILITWKAHFVMIFVTIIRFSIKVKPDHLIEDSEKEFLIALGLLCVQAFYLALIAMVWSYWKQLSHIYSIPEFFRSYRTQEAWQTAPSRSGMRQYRHRGRGFRSDNESMRIPSILSHY